MVLPVSVLGYAVLEFPQSLSRWLSVSVLGLGLG